MKKNLAKSELAIMHLLWEHESLTAREIRERLYPNSEKAQHGTVQRLLQRLTQKEFVTKDDDQFVHQFSSSMSREEYAGLQLEDLASQLTAGSIAPFITHLLDHKKISASDMDRIRVLLDLAKDNEGEDD